MFRKTSSIQMGSFRGRVTTSSLGSEGHSDRRHLLDSLHGLGATLKSAPSKVLAQIVVMGRKCQSPAHATSAPLQASASETSSDSISSAASRTLSVTATLQSPEARSARFERCKSADTPVHELLALYDDPAAMPPQQQPVEHVAATSLRRPNPVFDMLVSAVVDYVHSRINARKPSSAHLITDADEAQHSSDSTSLLSTVVVTAHPPSCSSPASADGDTEQEVDSSLCLFKTMTSIPRRASMDSIVPSLSRSDTTVDTEVMDPATPPMPSSPESIVSRH